MSSPKRTAATPRALTVGELRAQLAEYDDDTPLRIGVPDEELPHEIADNRFIATHVGPWRYKQHGGDWQDELAVTIEVYPLPEPTEM